MFWWALQSSSPCSCKHLSGFFWDVLIRIDVGPHGDWTLTINDRHKVSNTVLCFKTSWNKDLFTLHRTETHYSHLLIHTSWTVQVSLHMDTFSSTGGMAKSRILTQEFCISPSCFELSRSRAAGSLRDSHVESWVSSKQAGPYQWLAQNPCASSRLSASTSMDTTWWPGIMARPRTLGSPWENVSEDRKGFFIL